VFRIVFNISQCFEFTENSCTANLSKRGTQHTFVLKSVYWGKANIGISEIRALDLLGIFSAFGNGGGDKVRYPSQELVVKIYPAIPLLAAGAEFIRVLEESSVFDDNEQTREVLFPAAGFPGYEHRDYFPGDPLKSVNWKLSAKRDKLMVRKPEAFAGGSQILILDAAGCGYLPSEQLALESLLALASVLIKREIPCTALIYTDNWRSSELNTGHELEQFRLSLCEYSFSGTPAHGRLPDLSEFDDASGYVLFTARPDEDLHSLIHAGLLKQNDASLEIVSPVDGFANNWNIKEITGEVVFERS
jgi:hypothetical protein